VKRSLWIAGTLIGLGFAALMVGHLPWHAILGALVGMRVEWLAAAVVVNLLSPLFKGWAWHLILAPVSPHRWRSAQRANLAGTAVNSITVGVTGEAARVALLHRLDGVPVRSAALSVGWTRLVEAIGLALFLVLAPILLHLPAALRGLQLGAAGALAATFALSRFPRWARIIARLPRGLRESAAELARMSFGTRLIAPIGLTLLSWLDQWATYGLVLLAAGIPVRAGMALTALFAVNLGGLGRLTPGNIGVAQAAVVGALLPFGVSAERAIAAGLALQAVQVLPILALAAITEGWAGLRGVAATREVERDTDRAVA
jgi:uncharacterized membrane protein YbhN (UPF0104 family)